MSNERRWKDPFGSHSRIRAVVGEPVKEEFVGRYDDRGHLQLVPSGKTNLYEFIQSNADSVDINILMSKFKNGDVDVLSRVQGVYADITDMPKTMADLLNKVKAGEDAFMSLDVETRGLFDHSLAQWLASAGTPEWCDKMGLEYVDSKPKKKKSSKSSEKVVENPVEKPADAAVVSVGGDNV